MAGKRDRLIAKFARAQRGKKRGIPEDDPRWAQMPGHGQGQERKVGANVTLPRAYVSGGSRRGRTRA